MIQKRHPACRSFQKAEFQIRKSFGNLTGDEIAKADERRQMRCGEGAVELEIEKVQQMTAALAGVDADRQVELLRLGVNGKEMRMIEGQRADDAAEENPDGAILLGFMHLLDGCLDGSERQYGDPAKPPVALPEDLRPRDTCSRCRSSVGTSLVEFGYHDL